MKLRPRFVSEVLILGLALHSGARAAAPSAVPPEGVTLTYVANEGVLLADSHRKLLIDAPFTESFGIFAVPPAEALERMTRAAPPFDHLTGILVTHGDADHIGLPELRRHLTRDPGCVVFAPAEVCQALAREPLPPGTETRVKAAAQGKGPTEVDLGGLKVTAVPVPHLLRPPTMPAPPFNVAHVFTLGGIRFAHTGDMGPHAIEAVRASVLPGERIDVAIVNCYFFAPKTLETARAILAEMKPRLVLLAHLGPKEPEKQAEPILALPGFPPMVALEVPMQSYAVFRDGEAIRVEKR